MKNYKQILEAIDKCILLTLKCSFEAKMLAYNRDNGFSIKPILLQ